MIRLEIEIFLDYFLYDGQKITFCPGWKKPFNRKPIFEKGKEEEIKKENS